MQWRSAAMCILHPAPWSMAMRPRLAEMSPRRKAPPSTEIRLRWDRARGFRSMCRRSSARSFGTRWAPIAVHRDDGDVRVHVGGFVHFVMFFALTFGLAFLALLLFPERIKRIQSELRSDPLKCGLTGVVGSMAVLAMTI